MSEYAWVTLATNDTYALGALVLAKSLKTVNTKYDLVVLITPSVSDAMKKELGKLFNSVKLVDVLDSKDEANLILLKRPELGCTFTKLHCWNLIEYKKCVFLDADTFVLQNSDELLVERDEFSAAPDVGWPDCFNSGVFVFRPSKETFKSLLEFADRVGSFDGGDQGLLNLYFSNWCRSDISKHLPFIYNMCSTACYSYLPAFKQFGKDVKIVHFIANTKPWLQPFNTETLTVHPTSGAEHLQGLLQNWWNIFSSEVCPSLDKDMSGLAGLFAQIELGVSQLTNNIIDEHFRRQSWETGAMDYLGRDAFKNIWDKIESTLETSLEQDKSPEVLAKPTEQISTLPSAPVPTPATPAPVETKPEIQPEIQPPAISSDKIVEQALKSCQLPPKPQTECPLDQCQLVKQKSQEDSGKICESCPAKKCEGCPNQQKSCGDCPKKQCEGCPAAQSEQPQQYQHEERRSSVSKAQTALPTQIIPSIPSQPLQSTTEDPKIVPTAQVKEQSKEQKIQEPQKTEQKQEPAQSQKQTSQEQSPKQESAQKTTQQQQQTQQGKQSPQKQQSKEKSEKSTSTANVVRIPSQESANQPSQQSSQPSTPEASSGPQKGKPTPPTPPPRKDSGQGKRKGSKH